MSGKRFPEEFKIEAVKHWMNEYSSQERLWTNKSAIPVRHYTASDFCYRACNHDQKARIFPGCSLLIYFKQKELLHVPHRNKNLKNIVVSLPVSVGRSEMLAAQRTQLIPRHNLQRHLCVRDRYPGKADERHQ